jgi:hypothetical protein
MYSPKIHEALIPRLYVEAKRRGVPMTKLVNHMVASMLTDMEQEPLPMDALVDPIEKILAEVCRRDQFTCTQCGKSLEYVERYLVLHLVPRTRDARWPVEYELQCTRCLTSGQHAICEVVVERSL